MSRRIKFILSIIGLAAVIVPAVLLIVSASRTRETPAPVQEERTIDTQKIEETAKKLLPSPIVSSSSALPLTRESTSSVQFSPQ